MSAFRSPSIATSRKRIKQRSFIVVTIILLVLVILGACVPTVIQYFSATSSSQTKMVVVNNANPIAGMNDDALSRYIDTALNGTATQASVTKTSGNPPYSIRTAPAGSSISNLQKQVKEGAISILLVLDRAANGDVRFTYYTNTSTSSFTGDPHLSQVQALTGQLNLLDKASRLGLTPAQTSSLFAQYEPSSHLSCGFLGRLEGDTRGKTGHCPTAARAPADPGLLMEIGQSGHRWPLLLHDWHTEGARRLIMLSCIHL